jgi:glycine/D-amino acid oxidase-like deaminating enzyme
MAEQIALLHPLRARTTELKVSTLITDPIPESVLRIIMPLAEGCRYPFADDAENVAYGCIDEQRRMVFGAHVTALRNPDFAAIAKTMHATFPNLADAYCAAAGRPLGWQPYVTAERLCFTRDGLPNVGIIGPNRWVFYVHALGGHGLAIGTILGEAVAQKAWGVISGDPVQHAIFDDFASVRHGWLPPWQPVRRLTASICLSLETPLTNLKTAKSRVYDARSGR